MSTATSIIADTTAGAVQGVRTGGVVAFLGVPYAAAPVGERRFRAPEPVAPWAGVRDAVTHGPTAPMPGYPPPFDALLPNPVVAGDEYLNLSVWTPDPGAQGLPVLVWIHGGAFVNGSSAVPLYDGTAFARDGVVTVAVNYRLGAEGFALLPDAPPNLGLLDQVAALEWVRDNIAAFGGDPDAVTVAGESAGAMSVGALLAMPRAAGPVPAGDAAERGGPPHAPAGHRRAGGRLPGRRAGRARRPRAALRAVPAERVIERAEGARPSSCSAPDPAAGARSSSNIMMFEPVVDGDVLPAPPSQRDRRRVGGGGGRARRREPPRVPVLPRPTGVADRVEAQAARRRSPPLPAARRRARPLPVRNARRVARRAARRGHDRLVLPDPGAAARRVRARPAATSTSSAGSPRPTTAASGACHGLELPLRLRHAGRPRCAGVVGTDPPPRARRPRCTRAWVAFAPPETPAGLPTRRTGVPWPGSVRARIRPWRWSTIRGVTCGCCGTASADDRHHGGPR